MEFQSKAVQMKENVSKVIVGKGNVTDLILTALIAGGHVLLEDVPGTGKTMIAKSFAKSIDAEFARIQFTPDLLPSDITGINYYNQKQGEFVFRKGPVFSNILLADEINRATPRTQSALLECMEEHQVTVDGETRKLGFPFIVIATQNPIETAGTYQLPEAQLDRFLLQISMGYPKQNEELEIIKRFMTDSPLESLSAVCNADDVKGMVKEAEGVHVDEAIMNYIVDIADKTRNNINIAIGVQEHAAGGAARLAHPSDAATKRGGHAQRLFLRKTIHICKGSHDGLRTIIAALEQFNGFFHSVFHRHILIC